MKDETVRERLLEMAAARHEGGTFCPSEVARKLAKDWRPLMTQVREVAAVLVKEGRLVCTQQGRVVDPVDARGPIRLARS